MYLVIHHKTGLLSWNLQCRFENNLQLNILITTKINYLLFPNKYVGDIRFIK
jgi:hypothetical protein